MRSRYFIASLTLVAAASASAQSDDSDYSTKEIRAITHGYAKCIVAKHSAKASQALLQNVDNSTILRRYPTLIDGDCLVDQTQTSTMMRFSGDLYRYALADALVSREFAAAPAPILDNVPRLEARPLPERPRAVEPDAKKSARRKHQAALEKFDRAAAYYFLGGYGECVVRVDAAGAKALLLTKPDSTEEGAHFSALRPALATCLPEGQTLQFGKVALRGTIAINYYRLAHAARNAVATP